MGIRLVEPTLRYEEQVLRCRDKLFEVNSGFEGCCGLDSTSSYADWLDTDNRLKKTYGKEYVPSVMYLAIREEDDKVVGFLDYRTRLNEYLFKFGGNIGYLVMPEYRRMGYATEMLNQALEICKTKFKQSRVLVTCDKINIASMHTIIKCGGIFENEVYEGNTLVQRYWIDLS